MKFFVAALMFILGNKFVLTSPYICRNNEHCRCINKFEEYEFQCTSNNDNVVIRAVPNKYIIIDCFSTEFKVNILPNYTAGNIDLFELRFCPEALIDFSSVLEKFGIENLENLRLEFSWKKSTGKTKSVTKDFLRGLSSLRNLSVSVNVTDVEAFGNLSKSTNIYLENNYFQEVGEIFRIAKHLEVLHLSINTLTHIPYGAFQNFVELQQLRLWKNNLIGIRKYDFAGLNHLKSLELDRNHIQYIDRDGFSDLSELISINLRENQLGHISSNIFRRNRKLNNILIDYNSNITLDDYVFANLKNLSMVNLAQSGLRNIPQHVFEGSENIETLLLQNNFLREFSEGLFTSMKNLKKLNLSNNSILCIPDILLSPLVNLEVLDLSGNLMSEINDKIFKTTKNLKKLLLNNNKIKTIMPNAFQNNKALISIDLSNNLFDMRYEYVLEYNPFKNCKQIEELLLSGNRIQEFPSSIINMVLQRELNLRQVNFSSLEVTKLKQIASKILKVDLSNNQISVVKFKNWENLVAEKFIEQHAKKSFVPLTTILLYNNSLVCDCRIYDLVQYFRVMVNPTVRAVVDLRIGDSTCTAPDSLQHMKIENIQPQYITCPYHSKCEASSQCQCFYRPFDKSVVIDCSYRNLTECPRIDVNIQRVEMNLEGNIIRYGPNSSLGYDNVTNIFLSNNTIEQFAWVPPKIRILKLDGNQLTHLNTEVLKIMNSSSILTLYNNPWSCDCSALEFQNFIRAKFGKDSRNIVCKEDNEPLIEKVQLCEPSASLIMKFTILFIILTAFACFLYFFHEQEIRIWFLGKYLCFYQINRELDEEKIWDVFISYSYQDEHFVLQTLLPELEKGPNPFKTCIHVRDWIPGGTITENISNSVNNSRRTLVVLSNNFLESVWGKMEFRAAHTNAIEEGRARVIVIKYGDLDEDKIDRELKMYLRTNIYVEWEKPWFWSKLRYALSHSHSQNNNNKFERSNSIPSIVVVMIILIIIIFIII